MSTVKLGKRPVRVLIRVVPVLVGVLLGLLSACSDQPAEPTPQVRRPPSAELTDLYDQRLQWSSCAGQVQCASVRVPQDWARPSGEQITLQLARRPARGRAEGAVVVNFGGPGVAGAELLRSGSAGVTDQVARRRDVVSFDPRGTGRSAPLQCLDDAQLDLLLGSQGAGEPTLGPACQRTDAQLSGLVSTADAVSDLDLIRAVLDQPRLDYLGYSYGSKLGAAYLQRFGAHAGRFVLDGPLPPSLGYDELTVQQVRGLDTALRRYVRSCLQQNDCPLPGPEPAAINRLDELLAGAGALRSRDDRLTPSLAGTAVISQLYSTEQWPALTEALAAARDGAGQPLLDLADRYNGRRPDGAYTSNIAEAHWAVTCLDFPSLRGPANSELSSEIRRASTVLGPYLDRPHLACADWPVPNGPRRQPAAPGAPSTPPLVIATTGDPATVYPWGARLVAELPGARLLTVDGQAHTAYGRKNRCVNRAVEAYLLTGASPRTARC